MLCLGVWRQSPYSPSGVGRRKTYKHQNNVTGTMTRPSRARTRGQFRTKHKPLVTVRAATSIYGQLCARSFSCPPYICVLFCSSINNIGWTLTMCQGLGKHFVLFNPASTPTGQMVLIISNLQRTCPRRQSQKEAERRSNPVFFFEIPVLSSRLRFQLLSCGPKLLHVPLTHSL